MNKDTDTHDTSAGVESRKLNSTMLGKLLVVTVMMFGFGYGLVPLYKQICELTGVNILTQKDMKVDGIGNTQVDKTRTITVEFDANSQGPWRFRPTVSSMQVHPGEMTQVTYEVVNTQARSIDAQAIPSYAPQQASQTLAPNEAKQMPVVFYIDPALPKDVKTITLSYTFFEIAGQGKKAS